MYQALMFAIQCVSSILFQVPSAAPEVTAGGFSYNKADCVEGGMREVTVYWKVSLFE